MAEFDLFLSYASADLAAADALEALLQAPPRNRSVWRDRRGIQPGAPDFYAPILAGIYASANVLVLLSPRWLRSSVAARELSDAQAAGKKIIYVVHPGIPRDPRTAEGRERKVELFQELQVSNLASTVGRPDWIWLTQNESAEANYGPVEQALATDFPWKERHDIIVQRLNRWKAVRTDAILLRGAELAELMADALADAPGREPVLTEEQRTFLLESQRFEAAERERVEGLYWGAQARAAAFAARERSEAEPDVALLLVAEAAPVATVPEARAILVSLLHRYASLTKVINGHGHARQVSGVAFSPDGRWLASVDRDIAANDDRQAHLLVSDTETGREVLRLGSDARLTAVAWGKRWLAVASPGSIGWLRWDDWKEKFLGNTPTQLEGDVLPDCLAFSPPAADLPQGEVLAWGTQWGDIGLIHVGDHVRWQGRLSNDHSSTALTGLGWLNDARLITAESGRILVRPFPALEPAQEIVAPGSVFSLACDGERWVASCVSQDGLGLLLGRGDKAERFVPAGSPDLRLIATWAGRPEDGWILTGSNTGIPGVPAVVVRDIKAARETLLQGEGEPISKVAADPTGRFVAAGQARGRVWLWGRTRRSHLVSAIRPGLTVRCIAASTAGRAAVATQDGRILVFGPSFKCDPVVEATVPFLPIRLLFADAGRTLLVVAENGQLATIDANGQVRNLLWPSELPAPSDIVTAADQPIVAARHSDNGFAIFRLTESGLAPLHIVDAGMSVMGLALDPSGQRAYTLVNRFGLEVVSWRLDTLIRHQSTSSTSRLTCRWCLSRFLRENSLR